MDGESRKTWKYYLDLADKLYFEEKFIESIEAFKQSAALKESAESYRGLGFALL